MRALVLRRSSRSRIFLLYAATCHYYHLCFSMAPCVSALSLFTQVTHWLDHQRVAFACLQEDDGDDLRKNYNKNNDDQVYSAISNNSTTHLLWIHPTNNTEKTRTNSNDTTKRLWLHLIPSSATLDSSVKYQMTHQASQLPQQQSLSSSASSAASAISLIHLHQDQWERQTHLVQARLWHAIVSHSQPQQQQSTHIRHERRIYARQCQVQRIPSPQAQLFLQQHHMWSSVSAKYSYGLFDTKNHQHHQLVAVATFSSRRHIQRDTRPYRSHELFRFCTQSNVTVLGGCSKLIKAFERDMLPDDIVTVLDRDWTSTRHDNWKGFHSVHTMPPLPLAVRDGQRYHLIGAPYNQKQNQKEKENAATSITSTSTTRQQTTTTSQQSSQPREFVPWQVYQDLNECHDAQSAQLCLQHYGYRVLYDAGVERLLKIVVPKEKEESAMTSTRTTELYQSSIPQYAASYYSPNAGIAALLRHAEEQVSHLS